MLWTQKCGHSLNTRPIHTKWPNGPLPADHPSFVPHATPTIADLERWVRARAGVCVWFDSSPADKEQWWHGHLEQIDHCMKPGNVLVKFDPHPRHLSQEQEWMELADWEEALIHLDSDHTGNVGYYTPRAPTPGRRHH